MTYTNGVAGEQLRSLVERIERLESEKANISEDIKDVYGEAKSEGFDQKIIRKVIKLRRQEKHEVSEEHILLQLYIHAIGMEPLPGFAEACGEAEVSHTVEKMAGKSKAKGKQKLSISEAGARVLAQIKEQGGTFHVFNKDDIKLANMLELEGFLAGVAKNEWVLTKLGNDACRSA